MKNLRKVFAMVLVIAMAFSMVTIASAATPKVQDYADASSIKQTEAVDLLTAVGILNGINGSFNPTSLVTREQAAKIVCYMLLGPTGADGLKTSTSAFTDVAASRWSAPFIQYCVVKGIVAGMGDGTFKPEGNVTATQFAKMCLTALGYGRMGEYTGANWEINVIADAQRLGILTLNLDYTAAATREQVAQYAFNTYTDSDCYTVAYSKDISDYTTLKIGTLATQQKVTKSGVTAVNGTDTYTWMKDNVVLNSNRYAIADEKVLGTSNNGTALSKLTTVGSGSYVASLEATGVRYFLNGVEKLYTDVQTKVENTAMVAFGMGATSERGMSTTLVDTDNDGLANKVLLVEKTVTVLAADATVNSTGNITIPGICTNKDKTLIDGAYADMDKGDVVLSYYDTQGVYHVEEATKVTGQMTSGSAGMITFAGNLYFGSGLPGVLANSQLSAVTGNQNNFNANATVWLDNAGAVVSFKLDTAAASNFAMLVGYRYDAISGSAAAQIVKADGTVASFTIAADASGTVPNQASKFPTLVAATPSGGYLVSYVIGTDGKLSITPAGTADTVAAYTAKSALVGAVTANKTYYITSSTQVFYFDTTKAFDNTVDAQKVTATIGLNSTVECAGSTGISYYLIPGSGNVLGAIVFTKAATVSSSSNFAYVAHWAMSAPSVTYSGSIPTYTYNVWVNGEAKQLKASYGNFFGTAGLYKYDIGSNGYITGTPTKVSTLIYDATTGIDVTKVDTGYVALANNVTYLTNASTQYYLVDPEFPTANVAKGTLGESSGSVHYYVQYIQINKDNSKVADAIYYTYKVN